MGRIILTSDDFGLSQIYNEKIIEMLQLGYLTSTSVMVNRITEKQTLQVEKLKAIYKIKDISIGLHLELSECNFLDEIKTQWALFNTIFRFSPDYLDLHKNNTFEGDYNEIAKLCNLKNIPFRKYSLTSTPVNTPTLSIITTNESIKTITEDINNFEKNEIYELVFHIGVYDPNSNSSLNKERELDVEKLIEINQFIKEKRIILTNYNSLKDKEKYVES